MNFSKVKVVSISDSIPEEKQWALEPLYKEDVNNIRIWQIGFDGKKLYSQFGCINGKIQNVPSDLEVKGGKSIEHQAWQDASQKYLVKIRKDSYHTANQESKNPGIMLGHLYEKKKLKGKWRAIQPKIDGVRMYGIYLEGEIFFGTRSNKRYTHLTHLEKHFEIIMSYLPSGTLLDGELFSEKYGFQESISIINRKVNVSSKIKEIKWWLFDICIPENNEYYPFEKRIKILDKVYKKYLEEIGDEEPVLKLVTTHQVDSDEEMNVLYNYYLELGYEGIMIKHMSNDEDSGSKLFKLSLYRSGKHNNILKLKPTEDEEGTVIDIVEGTGIQKGLAVLVMKDPRGNIFNLVPATAFKNKKEIFDNKEEYIGKQYTYKYQELSNDGIPRFATGKGFRDYE